MSFAFTSACIGQIVSGQVRTEGTNEPISDVYVSAFIQSMAIPGVYTNAEGYYKIKLAVGKYEIVARHVSYPLESHKIQTQSTTDTIYLDFVMKGGEVFEPIEVVYITPKRNVSNVTTLNKKDFNVLPGSFDDPTRLLIKYPAISTVNDQANSVIYRGLPAHYMQWHLNGQEIVNPNHTSNAGTLSDLFSTISGGVNMLGGQSLDRAVFYGNPSSKSYNAISGVNDLETSELDRYIQLSLLGLEAGYNFKDFSVGYRYSFTGLLGDMGVDFGGEKIRFQDINFRYNPKLKKGNILFTAVYGTSQNDYSKSEIPSTLKEHQDINYKSSALLSTLNYGVGKHKIGLSYSKRSDERSAIGLVLLSDTTLTINDHSTIDEQKIVVTYSNKINNKLDIGINYQLVHYDDNLIFRDRIYSIIDKASLISTFASFEYKSNGNTANFHISPSYRLEYEDFSPDFNIDFNMPMSVKQSIDLKFGHTSQTQPSFVHLFSDTDFKLKATKSLQLDLAFNSLSSKNVDLEFHSFYHLIYDIPQTASGNSAFNNLDLPPTDTYTLSDQAKVVGVSGQGEFNLPAKISLNANLSLFQSSYRTLAVWVPSVQSFGHTFNLNIGKIFSFRDNSKYFRIGMSLHHRGGSKIYPLEEGSILTEYDYRQGPTETLSTYYRIDLRLSYQMARSTLSLDIQNITGRQNQAYYFRDQPSGQSTLQKQLGLIPVLSYKLFL